MFEGVTTGTPSVKVTSEKIAPQIKQMPSTPNIWSHPESNGDPRFRKPLLYPLELWDQITLSIIIGDG